MRVALAVSLLALVCCAHGNVPAFTIVPQSLRRGPGAPARVGCICAKKSRIEATPSFRHLLTSHKVAEAQRLASLGTSLRSKSQPGQGESLGSLELSRRQGLRERVANVTGSGNGRSVLAERARAAILAGRRACIVPGRGHVLQDSGGTSTHSKHSDSRGARAQHMEGQQQQGREAQEKVQHGQLQGKESHTQIRATEPPTREFLLMAAQLRLDSRLSGSTSFRSLCCRRSRSAHARSLRWRALRRPWRWRRRSTPVPASAKACCRRL